MHKEAFVYAAIRSQIKDGTRTASYPMADLAKLCKVDERTIYNYIDRLMSVGLFSLLNNKKKQLKGDHRYNVYLFPYIKDNCMLINPSFIEDESFTTVDTVFNKYNNKYPGLFQKISNNKNISKK